MKARIALMGVPGSGKTALAHTLKTALERDDIGGCQECRTPIAIIDDYVAEIEEETNLAMGFNASYVGNVHVALGRAQRERLSEAKTVITCGTLLDTTTYLVQTGVEQLRLDDEDRKSDSARRIESTMRFFACLYMDTFHYEHVFYLPAIQTDDQRYRELDKNLQAAFKAFNLMKVTPLMSEGASALEVTEKRCAEALKEIL